MNNKEEELYGLLGICQKAGKIASGGDIIENAIRGKKAMLIILARDASESTAKKLKDKAAFYGVTCAEFGTKEMLGKCIGRSERSALAIRDKGFSQAFISKYQGAKFGGDI